MLDILESEHESTADVDQPSDKKECTSQSTSDEKRIFTL
jgi:hypothetical protein